MDRCVGGCCGSLWDVVLVVVDRCERCVGGWGHVLDRCVGGCGSLWIVEESLCWWLWIVVLVVVDLVVSRCESGVLVVGVMHSAGNCELLWIVVLWLWNVVPSYGSWQARSKAKITGGGRAYWPSRATPGQ